MPEQNDVDGVIRVVSKEILQGTPNDGAMNNNYFSVFVTRDTTESARIPVIARDASEAAEKAIELARTEYAHLFEPNDPVPMVDLPYLGDEEEDVEEISQMDFKSLVRAADEKREFDPENHPPECHPLFKAFVRFLQDQIESGNMDAEGMATRLVRYALSPPRQMIEEFQERMGLYDETPVVQFPGANSRDAEP